MATTQKNREEVESILSLARKDIKGRYYIYERYKAMLQQVCETSIEYERAIYDLAKILKV